MILTIISVLFILFALLSILIGILSSRKKHWTTSLMIVLTSVVACVAALLLTNPVTWLIATPLTSFLEAMLGGNLEALAHDVKSLGHHLGDIVSLMLVPFVYAIIFLLIKLPLDKLIAPLLAKLVVKLADRDKKEGGMAEEFEKFKHKEHATLTLPSAIISTVCALLVFAVALLPFAGMFNFAGQTIASASDSEEAPELSVALTDNLATKTLGIFGADAFYATMADHHSDGRPIMITTEFQYIIDFINDFSVAMDESTTPEEKASALRVAADDYRSSDVLHEIASDFFNAASEYWINDEPFDGIERPEIGEGCDEIFVCFLECTKDSTPETMAEDFEIALHLMAFYVENEERLEPTGNPLIDLQTMAALVPEIEEIMGDNTRLLPIIELFIDR